MLIIQFTLVISYPSELYFAYSDGMSYPSDMAAIEILLDVLLTLSTLGVISPPKLDSALKAGFDIKFSSHATNHMHAFQPHPPSKPMNYPNQVHTFPKSSTLNKTKNGIE